ncbi:unnamed protein product [Paramecium sonneborni]|uniref:Uncharacterized protein n=1 Tax=Paramecium sonneborni TaxID=65129 RepID=A0A8S1NGP3_9CILI|nr:unnamed protein product [Paramecium sonneborni]
MPLKKLQCISLFLIRRKQIYIIANLTNEKVAGQIFLMLKETEGK